MPTLYRQLKKLPWTAHPRRLGREHGPRPAGPPHDQGRARAGLDRVRGRRPGRATAPHRHQEGKEDRRGRLPHHQRPRRRPRPPWPPGSAGTGRSRTSSTGSATSPTRKTSPWSGPETHPASWRRCAAWPSASCAWTATPTSPPPTATTPATRSAR